jgi:hypothetical protein
MSELILKKPLYTKIDISNMSKSQVLDILFFKESLDCYCPYCNDPSIFIKKENLEQASKAKALAEDPIAPYVEKDLFEEPEIYYLDFSCSRNNKHTLNIIYKVENKSIVKIGQSPSLFDIQRNDFKKYLKILGTSYNDLYRAILFYNSNFGVASFTHFRRIIENYFLKDAYERSKQLPDWNDSKYNESSYKEKLGTLKDLLPKTLVENPRLYSIISKGIHELEEEECLLYFEAIKESIFLSLDEKIDEDNKRKSKEKLKSDLSRIDNEINNKK